jgi:prepilin-type N-terminal cleavage/methylation domain-containing protein
MTRCPRRSGSTRQRGFTLVELLITLIVLTMIMGTTVVFFQQQNRSFLRSGEAMDLLQNARYSVSQLERLLRTLGSGVTGQQPMLVYGGNGVLAFNTDYIETDTTDYRWAVNFNPSVAAADAQAWDVARATAIPNSSPTYTYPPVTYTQANGAPSLAETKIFWFALDSTTARVDDYVLWERTNDGAAEMIAGNILAYPGRPFFEYFQARRLNTGADTMIIGSGALLPYIRRTLQAGDTPADTASKVRPDSVRAVRVNIRITNGQTGTAERTRQFSQLIQLPNNGLPSPNVCGRSPLSPTSVTATPDVTPGSGLVFVGWTRSPDHDAGEFDVRQYVLYQRDDTATTWRDPLMMIVADTTTAFLTPIAGLVSGQGYDFGVAAQDCTPSTSTIVQTTVVAP